MVLSEELFNAYIADTTILLEEMDLILKRQNSIGTLDESSVNALFRIFHTIKASAAVLDDGKIVDVAFKMENIIGYLRRHGIASLPAPPLFSLFFESEYYFRSELGSLSHSTSEFLDELDSFSSSLDLPTADSMMLSFESLRPLFQHVIDEMSAELGKEARLEFEGDRIYVERQVMTRLTTPLTQMIRNAMDHGIEMPKDRIAMGKDACGVICVTYGLEDNIMFVTVSNDGKTLSLKEILRRADSLNILKKPRDAYKPSEIPYLIMERGFTTKEIPTKYSGRGVGMDIIKVTAEDMGGTVLINSGDGSGFSMTFAFPTDDSSQRAAIRKSIANNSSEV